MQARFSLLFLSILLCPFVAFAQLGGRFVYSFLNAAPNARGIAYGGSTLATRANDLNVAFQNPALLLPSMHGQATVNYIRFPAGISAGSAAYATQTKKAGTWLFGMQYFNYGTFKMADETGQVTGTFHAADYNFQAGTNRQFKRLYVGANMKFIYSTIERYNSFGIAADVGSTYQKSDTSRFVATLLIRNAGVQLKAYNNVREPLPFQIQLGVSKQLAHMPFRYFLLLNNLQRYDITYINYNAAGLQTDLTTGEPIVKKPGIPEKLMRHVVLGGEFLFSKNFNLRLGYNYQHRREMVLDKKGGLAGFSWGVGIKVSKLQFSYGGATYTPGVYNSNFSLVTQLSDWKKERNKK